MSGAFVANDRKASASDSSVGGHSCRSFTTSRNALTISRTAGASSPGTEIISRCGRVDLGRPLPRFFALYAGSSSLIRSSHIDNFDSIFCALVSQYSSIYVDYLIHDNGHNLEFLALDGKQRAFGGSPENNHVTLILTIFSAYLPTL